MVSLPVRDDSSIDFGYMEAFIRALEEDRIRALEAYLTAAGFGDCELTDAERRAVQSVADGKVAMREFRIADLFSVETPRRRFNANAVKFGGTHPYVVRTSQSNGRRGTIVADEAWLNPGDTISFGQDTATIFYQPEAYFTGDKIKVMRPLSGALGERAACYLLAAMRKAFSTFAWGRSSFGEKVLKDVAVRLPATPSGEVDRAFMETFVRGGDEEGDTRRGRVEGPRDRGGEAVRRQVLKDVAMRLPVMPTGEVERAFIETFVSGAMKRAIRGVVAWKDREIAAAKQSVGRC